VKEYCPGGQNVVVVERENALAIIGEGREPVGAAQAGVPVGAPGLGIEGEQAETVPANIGVNITVGDESGTGSALGVTAIVD
jgi:hypothetical protein